MVWNIAVLASYKYTHMNIKMQGRKQTNGAQQMKGIIAWVRPMQIMINSQEGDCVHFFSHGTLSLRRAEGGAIVDQFLCKNMYSKYAFLHLSNVRPQHLMEYLISRNNIARYFYKNS